MNQADFEHPILPAQAAWEAIGLNIQQGFDDPRGFHLDLTLRRGAEVRRLRFHDPQRLEINPRISAHNHGVVILDISGRRLEKVNVLVGGFESNDGVVEFLARDVEALA
jgi:hypothetical protein